MRPSRKYDAIAEHYLLPAVLFSLNFCLVHLVYAFTPGSLYPFPARAVLAASFLLLGASLIRRQRLFLALSVLFYCLIFTVLLCLF